MSRLVSRLMDQAKAHSLPNSECTILVVDDEEVVREVVTSLLLEDGYAVQAVETGEAALEAIVGVRPAAVLVDKNLPGINGLQVIREGKEASPDSEFIMMTGYASLDSACEALDYGAFAYITKPFDDITDVKQRVLNALAKYRAVMQNQLLLGSLRGAYEQLYSSTAELLDEAVEKLGSSEYAEQPEAVAVLTQLKSARSAMTEHEE